MPVPTLPDDVRDLRLRQGHAWIERLADIEGWPDQERVQHHAGLQTTPLHVLEAVVERWRARMWQAMERTGQLATVKRTPAWGDAAPPEPRERRPKGLARALTPKPKRQPLEQAQLFPPTTDKDA